MDKPTWKRVKQILDDGMERWKQDRGRTPKLNVVHDGPLSWESKKLLMESCPYGLCLLEESKIGTNKAEDTNLIKILRRNIGGYRRMPSRGPYYTDSEISEIAQWIDAGAPD
jgi:hypothetical protein